MSKRKLDEYLEDKTNWKPQRKADLVQNSLDSDEEDAEVNEDRYNVMNEEDFEGMSSDSCICSLPSFSLLLYVLH